MKKTLLLLVLVIGLASAFALPLDKGQMQVNAGIGYSGWGLPIYVGLDYGITPDITVGPEVSFRSYNYWEYHHTIIGIYVNGDYHFVNLLNLPSNTDLYAGLNLGFNLWISPSEYGGTDSSGLGLGVHVGGRYYFTDRLGVNAEFGGGTVSGGKIGISYKL